MGVIHGVRGAYGEALAIYDRAEVDGTQPADEALLEAWIASAHAHRGDVEASRVAAEKAVALAISATTPGRSRPRTRRWASSTS